MGGFTTAVHNQILDHRLGGTAPTVPATLYLGLSTTTITAAGGNITEPSGNNYSRLAITNNKTNWSVSASGIVSNAVQFDLPIPSGSWGSLVDWFLSSASSGGTIQAYGTWPSPVTFVADDEPFIAIGALSFALTQGA